MHIEGAWELLASCCRYSHLLLYVFCHEGIVEDRRRINPLSLVNNRYMHTSAKQSVNQLGSY